MNRFNRPVVSMMPDLNVDFYSGILDKAQQNLNQAVSMQAAHEERIGNYNIHSKEDGDFIDSKSTGRIKEIINSELVSPSRLAGEIMGINRELRPYLNALKTKDTEVQMQRKMQAEMGIDWLGNDVANIGIVGKDGSPTDPSAIRGININQAQLRESFIKAHGAKFLEERDSGRYQKIPGFPGDNMYGRVVTSGLSAENKQQYAPGTATAIEIANSMFQTLPESTRRDLIGATGSQEAALQKLQQINFEAVNDPRFAYSEKITGAVQYTPPTTQSSNKGKEEEVDMARPQAGSPNTDRVNAIKDLREKISLWGRLEEFKDKSPEEIEAYIERLDQTLLSDSQNSKIAEARSSQIGARFASAGLNLSSALVPTGRLARTLNLPILEQEKERASETLATFGKNKNKLLEEKGALKKLKGGESFEKVKESHNKEVMEFSSMDKYGGALITIAAQMEKEKYNELENRLKTGEISQEQFEAESLQIGEYLQSNEAVDEVLDRLEAIETQTLLSSNSHLITDKSTVDSYYKQMISALGTSGQVQEVNSQGEVTNEKVPAKEAFTGIAQTIETSPKDDAIIITLKDSGVGGEIKHYAITKESGISSLAKEGIGALNDLYQISNSLEGLSVNSKQELGDIIFSETEKRVNGIGYEIVRDVNNLGTLKAYQVRRTPQGWERITEVSIGDIQHHYLSLIK